MLKGRFEVGDVVVRKTGVGLASLWSNVCQKASISASTPLRVGFVDFYGNPGFDAIQKATDPTHAIPRFWDRSNFEYLGTEIPKLSDDLL